MFEIAKEFAFEAAHSLNHLPQDHPCRRLHGHSYRFQVVCRGERDERGFVVDFADISKVVKPLVEQLDHRYLNDLFPFPTTAENLAHWLYHELQPHLPCLYQIHFFETQKTKTTYPV